jgi:hypothetical protein
VQIGIAEVVGINRVEQLLVRVLDDEHVLDLRLALEGLEQRHQAAVDDDRLVRGVIRDVADVARV